MPFVACWGFMSNGRILSGFVTKIRRNITVSLQISIGWTVCFTYPSIAYTRIVHASTASTASNHTHTHGTRARATTKEKIVQRKRHSRVVYTYGQMRIEQNKERGKQVINISSGILVFSIDIVYVRMKKLNRNICRCVVCLWLNAYVLRVFYLLTIIA